MKLCRCVHPVRDTSDADRLRCSDCSGWTPHGRPHSADRARLAASQVVSFTERIASDLSWLATLVHQPTHRPGVGRSTDTPNPVLGVILTNERRDDNKRSPDVVPYATIAARCLERALAFLEVADTAAGKALLAAEPNRTPDHTKAPYHDVIPPGRPDLIEAYEARARRNARGDGWGAA
jgi:hypothetical protein